MTVMNAKPITIPILLWVLATPLFGQQALNLDFEKKSVEGTVRPWGWELTSWGTNPFVMDSVDKSNGRYSLRADISNDQPVGLRYFLEPYFLLGKELSLSVVAKAQDLSGEATISLRYTWMQSEETLESTLITVGLSDADTWQQKSAEFQFPREAITCFLQIDITGPGAVWIDDIRLEYNKKTLTSLPVAPNFGRPQMDWLSANVKEFAGVDGMPPNPDLNLLKNVAGDAQIIALGESTHGTSEFFRLKRKVLQYAVEQLGYRVFAIEDNMVACEPVNEYVLGRSDLTARDAMHGLFAVWYTEEVLELVEWMKTYNRQHSSDPVYFVGFDMQDGVRPLKALYKSLEKLDTTLLARCQDQLADLEANASNSFMMTDSTKQAWMESSTKVLDWVETASQSWLAKASSSEETNDLLKAVQYARLIRQFAENAYKGHWSLYRDEAMAENVGWLLEKRYQGKKMVIWAHDVHIAQNRHPLDQYNLHHGQSMGGFLYRRYEGKYKAFGLMTYQGSYLALKSYSNFERVNAPLYPSPKGSLGHALHEIVIKRDHPYLFLGFQGADEWLGAPVPMRFANHVNIDYGFFQRVAIPQQFDGLFFIDETSPSKYMGK